MKRTKSTYQEHIETLSINERVAVFITDNVGTMYCAYLFACLGIAALAGALTNWEFGILCGLASSQVIQLVLLPIIMVGQNIQNRHSEIAAQADFETNIEAEKRIEELQKVIATMESEKLDKIILWMGTLLKAEIDRRKKEDGKGGQPKRSLSQ